MPRMLARVGRMLASLRLAVVLLAVLAGVLAWATIVEARNGREYAQWYIYGSSWFITILALLGLNILAAAWMRFPWRARRIGFVVTHLGLLVLLAGSVQTFLRGVEGQVILRERTQTDRMEVRDRSAITVIQPSQQGRAPDEFFFAPGPTDWSSGTTLDFGATNGFGIKILEFLRHANDKLDWVPDDSLYVGPAVRLLLSGPSGHAVAEDWLSGNRFGGEVHVGPTRHEILPVTAETMLEDFVSPPSDLGKAGVLSTHFAERMERVRVDEYLGKKIPLGETGFSVEIVAYLPDARPVSSGTFASRSDQPKNPLLELKVHQAGVEQPVRELAFAKRPLLNLDAVRGAELPVKFWYHHAGLTASPGALFLQTPSGKLYCRPVVGGQLQPAREVRKGDRIALGAEFHVIIQEHIPRARQQLTCVPVERAGHSAAQNEAAALVQFSLGQERHRVWLKRNDPQYGSQEIATSQGPVLLCFGYQQRPLGFHLKLDEFIRRSNPGGAGDAGFISQVTISDPAGARSQRRTISMNEPLVYGKFTLYQTSFQDMPGHMQISVLTAAYDPGRPLKYAGSLLLCLGMAIMFFLRTEWFESKAFTVFGKRSSAAAPADSVAPAHSADRVAPPDAAKAA